MPKKMLWKVGVYSCLSERLIRDGRDSAKRVVSDTDTPKVLLKKRGTKRTVPFVPLLLDYFFAYKTYLEYLAVLKPDKQKVG